MATTIFDAYSEIVSKKKPALQNNPEMFEFYSTNCKSKLAAIFQIDGEFCTECGQIDTHPDIEAR